jgi:dynein intermediate chain 2
MDLITFPYSRDRSTVGRRVAFEASTPELLVEIAPNASLRKLFVTPDVQETEISNVRQLSEHSTSTEHRVLQNTGMFHAEGGWPKDVDATEPEQMARYKRKLEKEDGYSAAVRLLLQAVRPTLRQNNAIDIYTSPTWRQGTSSGASSDSPTEGSTQPIKGGGVAPQQQSTVPPIATTSSPPSRSTFRILTSLSDPFHELTSSAPTDRRTATCCSWSLAESMRGKVAVAFSGRIGKNLGGGDTLSGSGTLGSKSSVVAQQPSYIYDLHSPHAPETSLVGPSPIATLQWSPRDMHWIGAGCADGTVCLFDIRRAPKAAFRSSTQLKASPTGGVGATPIGIVTGLEWMPVASKANEIVTVQRGSFGYSFVWDIRNFAEPVEALRLATKGGQGQPPQTFGASCSNYCNLNVGPGKLLLGTTSGHILAVSRKGMRSNTGEGTGAGAVNPPPDRVQTVYGTHHTPVAAVERNPIATKCFASAGDWVVKLWHEDIKTPIVQLPWASSPVVDIDWHPLRASILAIALSEGVVQLFDLLESYEEPKGVFDVKRGIHNISFNFDGTVLAVGTDDGTVILLEVFVPDTFFLDEIVAPSQPLPSSPSSQASSQPNALNTQSGKAALQQLLEREYYRERLSFDQGAGKASLYEGGDLSDVDAQGLPPLLQPPRAFQTADLGTDRRIQDATNQYIGSVKPSQSEHEGQRPTTSWSAENATDLTLPSSLFEDVTQPTATGGRDVSTQGRQESIVTPKHPSLRRGEDRPGDASAAPRMK